MRYRRRLLLAAFVAAAFIPVAGCETPPPPPPPPPGGGDIPDAWPFCVCGDEIPATMLDQIEIAVNDARAANTISIMLHGQMITRITKCRTNCNPSPLTYAEHCAKLTTARNAAWTGNWGICYRELEHGH